MRKLLVFTDLDGTLLDHKTYDYAPAKPAIAQLQQNGHVLILNSSKTQAEQAALRAELGNKAPFVVENGAAIICPPHTPGHSGDQAESAIHVLAANYGAIREVVQRLRQDKGYRFRGFGDMATEEIAKITGLSHVAATAAKQRNGSEPLLWEDTEENRSAFVAQIELAGLQVTQGGRFLHVMGKTDKGVGVQWLAERYRQAFPATNWLVVALGDSPNDGPMLQAADIGVLIPNPHRQAFAIAGVRQLLQPEAPGPQGWAEAITHILKDIGYSR